MNGDGYCIFENVIAKAECDRLLQFLTPSSANKSRAGVRNLMTVAAFREFANDERLRAVVKDFSGKAKVPFKATLFEKSGRANWLVAFHQDTALPLTSGPSVEGWGPASVKKGINFVHAPTWALSEVSALRIHLDASTDTNGPLRVIPGSHHERILDEKEFAKICKSRLEVRCVVGKGGVVAMSPLIFHASSKALSDEPRRVLHIEYAPSLHLSPEITLAIA